MGLGLDQVVQLVILLGQVEGNLSESGRFWPDNILADMRLNMV